MSGITYMVDDRGHKKAVVIDLHEHGDLWEDFYDAMLARSRKHEPRESLASIQKRLARSRRG